MRRRALAAVAVAAALAGAGTVRAAPAVADLAPVVPRFDGAVPVQTLVAYGERGMHVVGYEHGATTRITVPVRNDGRLPVTVTSAALGGGVAPLLAVREVTGLPLALGPGETGTLDVTAELGNCRYYHEREVQNYAGVELGFRVLGGAGTQTVAFDRPLMVHSPMIVGCPDRLLNRQGNDRSDLTDAA